MIDSGRSPGASARGYPFDGRRDCICNKSTKTTQLLAQGAKFFSPNVLLHLQLDLSQSRMADSFGVSLHFTGDDASQILAQLVITLSRSFFEGLCPTLEGGARKNPRTSVNRVVANLGHNRSNRGCPLPLMAYRLWR